MSTPSEASNEERVETWRLPSRTDEDKVQTTNNLIGSENYSGKLSGWSLVQVQYVKQRSYMIDIEHENAKIVEDWFIITEELLILA